MNYSVFIKSLKYIFLLLSISILILIIYNNNPIEKEKVYSDFSNNESDFMSVRQVLRKPTFIGIDKKNQPFKVMAKEATRLKQEPNIFNLEKPTGEINTGNEKFFLSGDKGIFNKNVEQLEVKGNVKFNDGEEMTFTTSEMYFDFKKEILSGNKRVNGKKNNSIIVSEGFKILNNGEQIFFTGKTKLKLINEKNK